jgi:parallel beta-helix repeat protein
MIFWNAGVTYAQNCVTGAMLVQSTASEAVINDAIAALTSGGKLFIEAGTYTFTTLPINMGQGDFAAIGSTSVSNIELYGEGNSTILSAGTNLNGVIIGIANANGWYIHDLQINGNGAHQSASGASAPGLIGIELYNSKDSVIEHCYVHDNKTYGVAVYGTEDSILNNWIVNSWSNGITIFGGSDYSIRGNVVDGSSDVGISISGEHSWATPAISRVTCIGNIIQNANLGVDPWGQNSGVGIAIGDQGPATQITVSENQVYGAKIAVFCSGLSASMRDIDVQISDNQLYSPTSYGVQVIYTTSVVVQGNIVDTPTSMGIITDPTDVDISLSGNHISSAGQYGIDNSAPYALIEDNHFDGGSNYGTTHYGVYTNAAYTSIIGNTFVGAYLTYAAIMLDSGSNFGLVSANTIYPTSNRGCIYVVSTDNTVSGNRVYGSTVGIGVSSTASRTFVVGNNVAGNTYPISGSSTPYGSGPITATGVVIENNTGYNPIGKIATPFTTSNTLVDSGTTASMPNATTITNYQSPKTVSILISSTFATGHTFILEIDGATIVNLSNPAAQSIPYIFTLQPRETFYCQYQSGKVTVIVSGQ